MRAAALPLRRRFPSTLGVLNSLRAWLGQPPLDSAHGLELLDELEGQGDHEQSQSATPDEGSELDDAMAMMSSRTRKMESALLHRSFGGASTDSGAAERALREALHGAVVQH